MKVGDLSKWIVAGVQIEYDMTVHSMYGYMTICSVSFRRNLHSCWNRCVSGGFAMETMLFEHKCCRQSFSLKVVGWNGTYCLLSSWVLVVKNVQHQQHHAEYQQNTSNQLAWRNVVFTMFLSCMDSVLAAEIDTEVYQLVANKYSRLVVL